MEWKDFSESSVEYPEKIVSDTIEGFSKATKGLAEIVITELNDVSSVLSNLSTEFNYAVYLKSDMVSQYRMKIFTFGYNVELLPISVNLNKDIYFEIHKKNKATNTTLELKTESDFKLYLQAIFSSQHFKKVVGGLLKIAKKVEK